VGKNIKNHFIQFHSTRILYKKMHAFI